MSLVMNLKAPMHKKLLAKASQRLINKKTGRTVWFDHSRVGFYWYTPYVGRHARQLIRDMQDHYGNKTEYGAPGQFSTALVARLRDDAYPMSAERIATKKFLEVCDLSYQKRGYIHYSYPYHNAQRMDGIAHKIRPPHVPPYADCSSWVMWVYWVCGFPSPCGTYAWGSSWTMLDYARNGHAKRILRGREKAGDIVLYTTGVGHAEVVVSRGRVLTNGSEMGPYYRGIGEHSGTAIIYRFAPFK